ncbi:hypothetical protein ABZY09_43475 [Streptomyces sp. NPDC002928]|uniref:hypothetical protein n=1 Tax=Streptomyces sp. NPDC002928 TaxID=3154440 RepID=UPI0033B8C28B
MPNETGAKAEVAQPGDAWREALADPGTVAPRRTTPPAPTSFRPLLGYSSIYAGGDIHIDGSAVALNHSTATTDTPAEADRDAAIAELRAAARLLLEQLRRDQDQYEDGAELVDAAEHFEAELTRDEPRRTTLLRWLGFIAPGVRATAAVARDVAAIQNSVTNLL